MGIGVNVRGCWVAERRYLGFPCYRCNRALECATVTRHVAARVSGCYKRLGCGVCCVLRRYRENRATLGLRVALFVVKGGAPTYKNLFV